MMNSLQDIGIQLCNIANSQNKVYFSGSSTDGQYTNDYDNITDTIRLTK